MTPLRLGQQMGQGGPGAAEGAGQRDVEHAGPLLVGHVDQRDGPAQPGVVHGHVESPEVVDGRRVERLHLALVRHVTGHGPHRAARLGLQLLGRLGQPPGVGVGDDDRGALLEAPAGRRRADPRPGGGGDDHHLADQQPVAGGRGGRWRWVKGFLQAHEPPFGSGGRPSTRSPMMLRWIWLEPP